MRPKHREKKRVGLALRVARPVAPPSLSALAIAEQLEHRIAKRLKDIARLEPLVGQLVTCEYLLTATGAMADAWNEIELLTLAATILKEQK